MATTQSTKEAKYIVSTLLETLNKKLETRIGPRDQMHNGSD